MSTSMCVAVALLVLGANDSPGYDAGLQERITKLSAQGRLGKVEELVQGSSDPLARIKHAILIAEDNPRLRARGVTQFDSDKANRLALETLPFLQEKAPSDAVCAMYLGSLYEWGVGVKKDGRKAFEWFRYAASKGDASAMHKLARCYSRGDGVARDMNQVILWLKKGIDAGDVFSLACLADIYRVGDGVPKNPALANSLFEKAAKAGSVDAMLALGLFASERVLKAVDNRDEASAVRYVRQEEIWIRKASESGDAHAAMLLGDLLRNGRDTTVGVDSNASFVQYKLAADSGLSRQLSSLACCYLKGWGCTANPARAEKIFRQALVAAKRDHDPKEEKRIAEVLAETTIEDRITAADRAFDWGDSVEPSALADPPAVVLGAVRSKAGAKPRRSSGRKRQDAAPALPDGTKLVLSDLTMTAGVGGTFSVDGRVKNISSGTLKFLMVNIRLEDRAGRLLATMPAFVIPDDLEAGGIATFKAIDAGYPTLHHVKLDFTSEVKAVPWVDRSGTNTHQ